MRPFRFNPLGLDEGGAKIGGFLLIGKVSGIKLCLIQSVITTYMYTVLRTLDNKFQQVFPKTSPLLNKALTYIAFSFFTFSILVSVLCLSLEDIVHQTVATALKKSINTYCKIERMQLSPWRHFPSITCSLEGVLLKGKGNAPFVKTQRLDIVFNAWDLWQLAKQRKFTCTGIQLQDGHIHISYLNSLPNYDIFKPSSDNSEKNLELLINSCQLKNCTIHFTDATKQEQIQYTVDRAGISAEISNKEIELNIQSSGKCNYQSKSNQLQWKNKNLHWKGIVHYIPEKNYWTFQKNDLVINDLHCIGEGSIQNLPDAIQYQLQLQAKPGNPKQWMSLLPIKWSQKLNGMKLSGTIGCLMKYQGIQNKTSQPQLYIQFQWKEGACNVLTDKTAQLKNIQCIATYQDGPQPGQTDALLNIKQFSGQYQQLAFQGQCTYQNFMRPVLTAQLQGSFPLSLLQPFIPVQQIQGVCHFNQIQVKHTGNITDVTQFGRGGSASGTCRIEHCAFRYENQPINIPKALIQFNQQQIDIRSCQFQIPGAHGQAQLNLPNFIIQPKMRTIPLRGSIDFNQLQLDVLQSAFTQESNPRKAQAQVVHQTITKPNILWNYQLKLNAPKCTYQKLLANNLNAQLNSNRDLITLDGGCSLYGGKIQCHADINRNQLQNWQSAISVNGIPMKELFQQCDNFDQDVITHQHIQGEVHAQLLCSSTAPENISALLPHQKSKSSSPSIQGAMTITHGELKNLDLLNKFSQFIHRNDLEWVKFDALENVFYWQDGNLTLPVMTINNNALSLELCGSHQETNAFQYFLKVNGGQVLLNRISIFDAARKPKAYQDKGLFLKYYVVSGKGSDISQQESKSTVIAAFDKSWEIKKRILQNIQLHFGKSASPGIDSAPLRNENPSTQENTPTDTEEFNQLTPITTEEKPADYKPLKKNHKNSQEPPPVQEPATEDEYLW